MEEFINQTLEEMQEKENKKVNNIIGLIMRKCGVSNLIINEEELCFSVQNEVYEIYDPINHCIKLRLKED